MSNETDFISFLDEHNNQKDIYVKIIDIGNSFVTFETKEGNSFILSNALFCRWI